MSANNFEGVPITNGKLDQNFRDESPPIGRGRFGIVVKANNKQDNQEYAIKKIIIRSKLTNYNNLCKFKLIFVHADFHYYLID